MVIKNKLATMECKHEDYEVKQVMDMRFCVCSKCGFQWKGDKPAPETDRCGGVSGRIFTTNTPNI